MKEENPGPAPAVPLSPRPNPPWQGAAQAHRQTRALALGGRMTRTESHDLGATESCADLETARGRVCPAHGSLPKLKSTRNFRHTNSRWSSCSARSFATKSCAWPMRLLRVAPACGTIVAHSTCSTEPASAAAGLGDTRARGGEPPPRRCRRRVLAVSHASRLVC